MSSYGSCGKQATARALCRSETSAPVLIQCTHSIVDHGLNNVLVSRESDILLLFMIYCSGAPWLHFVSSVVGTGEVRGKSTAGNHATTKAHSEASAQMGNVAARMVEKRQLQKMLIHRLIIGRPVCRSNKRTHASHCGLNTILASRLVCRVFTDR